MVFGCCVRADLFANEAVSCQGYIALGLDELIWNFGGIIRQGKLQNCAKKSVLIPVLPL